MSTVQPDSQGTPVAHVSDMCRVGSSSCRWPQPQFSGNCRLSTVVSLFSDIFTGCQLLMALLSNFSQVSKEVSLEDFWRNPTAAASPMIKCSKGDETWDGAAQPIMTLYLPRRLINKRRRFSWTQQYCVTFWALNSVQSIGKTGKLLPYEAGTIGWHGNTCIIFRQVRLRASKPMPYDSAMPESESQIHRLGLSKVGHERIAA